MLHILFAVVTLDGLRNDSATRIATLIIFAFCGSRSRNVTRREREKAKSDDNSGRQCAGYCVSAFLNAVHIVSIFLISGAKVVLFFDICKFFCIFFYFLLFFVVG